MKITPIIAGISAAAFILATGAAMAQGRGPTPPMTKAVSETADESVKHVDDQDGLQAFAKADKSAGKTKKFKSKSVARSRGANSPGFCPPGQKKKAGQGSRFQC
jgi:hypothetical protein